MGYLDNTVEYGFGQLGSAFQNLAKPVYPPKDHVIVAIQFLADNIPTVLESEKLDEGGPNFPVITASTSDHLDAANNNYFNFNYLII